MKSRNLLNWGPFEGVIHMLYRTLKEWLFLQSLSAIIYKKEITLPSGEGKADSLTKFSIQKTSSPFEGAGEKKTLGLPPLKRKFKFWQYSRYYRKPCEAAGM